MGVLRAFQAGGESEFVDSGAPQVDAYALSGTKIPASRS